MIYNYDLSIYDLQLKKIYSYPIHYNNYCDVFD